MRPTREDLIEMGYLKPGDTLAKAPKCERKIFLDTVDLEYAERHAMSIQEMKDFKREMIIEEEITRDALMRAAQDKNETYNSPQAHYFGW